MIHPDVHIRPAEPADVDQWAALRALLWPEAAAATLVFETVRFFAEPPGPGAMPEAVLVAAVGSASPRLVGFAGVSRGSWCPRQRLGRGGQDAGFEEVEVIRCFRKELAPESAL